MWLGLASPETTGTKMQNSAVCRCHKYGHGAWARPWGWLDSNGGGASRAMIKGRSFVVEHMQSQAARFPRVGCNHSSSVTPATAAILHTILLPTNSLASCPSDHQPWLRVGWPPCDPHLEVHCHWLSPFPIMEYYFLIPRCVNKKQNSGTLGSGPSVDHSYVLKPTHKALFAGFSGCDGCLRKLS